MMSDSKLMETSQPQGDSRPVGLYVGWDWSDKKHDLYLRLPGQTQGTHEVIPNTPERLHAWLQKTLQRLENQRLVIAIEASRSALLPIFRQYQDRLTVYLLNPKSLAKYRETFRPSGSKDDLLDCQLLADIVISHPHQLHPWPLDDPQTELLATLAEDRRKLVDARTLAANQLKAQVKLYFPQVLGFLNDDLTTVLASEFILKWPSLALLQAAKPEAIRKFFTARKRRLTDALEAAISQLPKAVAVTERASTLQPAIRYAQALAAQLQTLHPLIKAYDEEIHQQCQEHPLLPMVAQLPGAGPVLKARLLAALGGLALADQPAVEVAAKTGIAPVKRASGQTEVIHRRYAFPHFIHQTFIEFADQSSGWSTWAKSFVAYKKAKGWKYDRIMRALAYKWIRILVALARSGAVYNESQYLEALAKQNCPYLDYVSEPKPAKA
jgi:transposase